MAYVGQVERSLLPFEESIVVASQQFVGPSKPHVSPPGQPLSGLYHHRCQRMQSKDSLVKSVLYLERELPFT